MLSVFSGVLSFELVFTGFREKVYVCYSKIISGNISLLLICAIIFVLLNSVESQIYI